MDHNEIETNNSTRAFAPRADLRIHSSQAETTPRMPARIVGMTIHEN